MMTFFFGFVNRLASLLNPFRSLRILTYWTLLRKSKIIRLNLLRYLRGYATDIIHKPSASAFIVLFIAILFGVANFLCSFDYSGTLLDFLNFVKLNKDSAKSLLADNLANASSIVGLSFVVLGFLFEVIKDKTGRELKELLRETRIFNVLSVTLISLLYLVVFNSLKNSLSNEDLINISISSSYILIVIIASTGYQFNRLIALFSKKELTSITLKAIRKAALNARFKERFVYQSKVLMADFFNKSDLQQFSYLNRYESLSLNLSQTEKYCADVNLLMLKYAIKWLPGVKEDRRFNEIYLDKSIPHKYPMLFYSHGVKRNLLSFLFFRFSFYLKKSDDATDQFSIERATIATHLVRTAESGDIIGLKQQLELVNNIYDVYLETRG
jgi:hypothetical protein